MRAGEILYDFLIRLFFTGKSPAPPEKTIWGHFPIENSSQP
jgi:hypothetical protein